MYLFQDGTIGEAAWNISSGPSGERGGELKVLDELLKCSLHGFAESSAELSVRGLLTAGSPANSLRDQDLVSLFNLNFDAGPRFSCFEIVFVSIVFDANVLVNFLKHAYDFSGLHCWESYNILENEHHRFSRVLSLIVML